MRLLALMPVKNEAGRHLSGVLDHLLGIVDGVFVYDDRSTDDTPAVVCEKGIPMAIRPSEMLGFAEHEGLFRQWGYDRFVDALKPEAGDWVLAIDADEKLYGTRRIRELMAQPHDVLGVSFVHMWNATHYRVDKAWAPNISSRLFRFQDGGQFLQRRLACGSEPSYVLDAVRAGRVLWTTGLVMCHLGYERDEDKAAKHARYAELDGGEFHAGAHIASILDPDPMLVKWVAP
jgi:hypothetical protein